MLRLSVMFADIESDELVVVSVKFVYVWVPLTELPAASEQSAKVTVSVLPSVDLTTVTLPPSAQESVTVPALTAAAFALGCMPSATRRSMARSTAGTIEAGAALTAAALPTLNAAGITIASAAVAFALL
jgi:hypothetical protein